MIGKLCAESHLTWPHVLLLAFQSEYMPKSSKAILFTPFKKIQITLKFSGSHGIIKVRDISLKVITPHLSFHFWVKKERGFNTILDVGNISNCTNILFSLIVLKGSICLCQSHLLQQH